jgi:prevent-host-death family protein
MGKTPQKGAEEARNQLPSLLEQAERGRATIITKHGKEIAVLAPIEDFNAGGKQNPLTKLRGSGRGLWGDLDTLRDEWSR